MFIYFSVTPPNLSKQPTSFVFDVFSHIFCSDDKVYISEEKGNLKIKKIEKLEI